MAGAEPGKCRYTLSGGVRADCAVLVGEAGMSSMGLVRHGFGCNWVLSLAAADLDA